MTQKPAAESDDAPITVTADRAMFDEATHRLALALTESPEKRDPALLLAQLIADMGGTVPVDWHTRDLTAVSR